MLGGRPFILSLLFIYVFFISPSASALAEDFYKTKTINFIVGTSPGGGFDTYTRATSRYIGRHIPGQPKNPSHVIPRSKSGRRFVSVNLD